MYTTYTRLQLQATFALGDPSARTISQAQPDAVSRHPQHVISDLLVPSWSGTLSSFFSLLRHLAAGERRIWVLLAEPLCVSCNGCVCLVAQPPPLLAPRALQQGR